MALVRQIETDDFDELSSAFFQWDHRLEQLDRGRFQGRLSFADLEQIQLFDIESNRCIRSRGLRKPETVAISPVLAENAGARWRGRELRPGMVNIAGAGIEVDHTSCSRDYRQTALAIHVELLNRTAEGLIGLDWDTLRQGIHAFQLEPETAVALATRWRHCLKRLEASPSGLDDELQCIDPIELASDLLRTLCGGRIVDPFRTTPFQRQRVVRQAEEFALADPDVRVSILQLCEHTGVSERTLHYAFMEVTGLSPKDYLKTIRLNLARRQLIAIGPGRGHIQQIAFGLGFTRPGAFAADYHRLFGEFPRTTIHRRRASG